VERVHSQFACVADTIYSSPQTCLILSLSKDAYEGSRYRRERQEKQRSHRFRLSRRHILRQAQDEVRVERVHSQFACVADTDYSSFQTCLILSLSKDAFER
jgi:hypothetical protein